MPLINTWNGFDPLEEIWLGDVYPEHFYDYLPTEVRDVFRIITEWTKEDLTQIEKFLTDRGIVVRRPDYGDDPEQWKVSGMLQKPAITPRDDFLAYGNRLMMPWPLVQDRKTLSACAWFDTVNHYRAAGENVIIHGTPFNISGACSVRLGLDFYLDCVFTNRHHDWQGQSSRNLFETRVRPLFPQSRCHYIDNGGHVDGCFALLKPGVILATGYFDSYDDYYPGWRKVVLSAPEFADPRKKHYDPAFSKNLRWRVPGTDVPSSFNEHVIKYAQDWVGNYQETYFEVNCLMIDTENVLMLGKNPSVCEALAKENITVHEMPFRCRTFWDGGLHCITLDIRRRGNQQDYFGQKVDKE